MGGTAVRISVSVTDMSIPGHPGPTRTFTVATMPDLDPDHAILRRELQAAFLSAIDAITGLLDKDAHTARRGP